VARAPQASVRASGQALFPPVFAARAGESGGCTTADASRITRLGEPIRGVNARMFVNFDLASVTIHRSDKGAHGWF